MAACPDGYTSDENQCTWHPDTRNLVIGISIGGAVLLAVIVLVVVVICKKRSRKRAYKNVGKIQLYEYQKQYAQGLMKPQPTQRPKEKGGDLKLVRLHESVL